MAVQRTVKLPDGKVAVFDRPWWSHEWTVRVGSWPELIDVGSVRKLDSFWYATDWNNKPMDRRYRTRNAAAMDLFAHAAGGKRVS